MTRTSRVKNIISCFELQSVPQNAKTTMFKNIQTPQRMNSLTNGIVKHYMLRFPVNFNQLQETHGQYTKTNAHLFKRNATEERCPLPVTDVASF
jgi:hypothetical protein